MYSDTISVEIDKAYEGLRGIDSSLKSLTGRAPPPSDRIGGRGRGRGGGIAARLGPAPMAGRFQQPVHDRSEFRERHDVPSILGRRRPTFAPSDFNDTDDLYGVAAVSKRPRRQTTDIDTFQYDDDFDTAPMNKPSLASSVIMPTIETKSRESAITELKQTERKEQSTRNRRLFANLVVGTLQKFRKDEKKVITTEKVQLRKQKEIEQKLEDIKREERNRVSKERNELMDQRKNKEREIQRLTRKKAIIQYAEREQEHMRKFQNFIQTQAKPPIFYLPSKHTLRTLELLKNTAKRVEEQVNKRKEQLERDLKAVDAGARRGREDDQATRRLVQNDAISKQHQKSAADKERDSRRRRRGMDSDVEMDSESEEDQQEGEDDGQTEKGAPAQVEEAATDDTDVVAALVENGQQSSPTNDQMNEERLITANADIGNEQLDRDETQEDREREAEKEMPTDNELDDKDKDAAL